MNVPDTLLKQVKDAMRLKGDVINDIIMSDIKAGALELRRVGIQVLTVSNGLREDALLYKALELYVKAEEDFQGKGEQYRRSFEGLRDALSLDGEYREKRSD